MRLEFEQNVTTLPHIENQNSEESASAKAEQMLREGIKTAQEGRRAEAKEILLGVTEIDPNNEKAWLWLASISEYPEELLVFLKNVLRINPDNKRALEWKKATQSLLAKTLVQRGADASKENRKEFARQCFEQAIEQDAENEMAWLSLASVSDSDEEKAACYEKVLSLNPDNEAAQSALKSLRTQKTESMLHEAISAAVNGELHKAQQVLAIVLDSNAELEEAWVLKAHIAETFEERAESLLKIKALNPDNEMAKACLASWRALTEKASGSAIFEKEKQFLPEDETVFASESSESNVPNEDKVEQLNADFTESDDEQAQSFTERYSFVNEHAPSENPTQDLHSTSLPETFLITEPTEKPAVEEKMPSALLPQPENLSEPEEESPSYSEFHDSPEEESPSYSEFHDSQVSFEAQEDEITPDNPPPQTETEANRTSEVLAESNENYSLESQPEISGEDVQLQEQENQVHSEYFSAPSKLFVSNEEQPEMSSEKKTETEESIPEANTEEEWKDTSPHVFIGYTPQPVQNSYQMPAAESVESAEENFSPKTGINQESNSSQINAGETLTTDPPVIETKDPNSEESFAPIEKDTFPTTKNYFQSPKTEIMLCPFCNAANEKIALSCHSCQAVISLTELETLLNQNSADEEILKSAVESFEREHVSFGLSAENLTFLGIGHLNLKNFRQGFMYLQEALQMDPDNLILNAHVKALDIRLAEMEKQQSAHDLIPKNRKILVVDDSPTVRKLISGKLEKCGHEVICAVDGFDALEKLKDLTPDLILLDITMPRMDGYQVCKEIRNNEATKNVPVVMISGKDGFFDKVRGRMAGTSGYITKPFGPETLMKTIETYLHWKCDEQNK